MHTRSTYKLNQAPVVYFSFPLLRSYVAIRPGDILFLNPNEPHAVSFRTHNSDEVICISVYLKTKNIGLNDNSLPMTHRKNLCDDFYLESKGDNLKKS